MSYEESEYVLAQEIADHLLPKLMRGEVGVYECQRIPFMRVFSRLQNG